MIEIKICGIKSYEDAKMCLDLGVDNLGFLVGQTHTSTDFITVEMAKSIIVRLSGIAFFATLVTHLTNEFEIIKIVERCNFNSIQFHSNISDCQVEKIKKALPNVRIVRLIHISEKGEVCSDLNDIKIADLYLLDSFNLQTNQVGGTGKIHDWQKSAELASKLNKPVVLAGGLNSDNVEKAISIVKPFGVDVNSGVKNDVGCKDRAKVKCFIRNARGVVL